jgi:hypothetical protein
MALVLMDWYHVRVLARLRAVRHEQFFTLGRRYSQIPNSGADKERLDVEVKFISQLESLTPADRLQFPLFTWSHSTLS